MKKVWKYFLYFLAFCVILALINIVIGLMQGKSLDEISEEAEQRQEQQQAEQQAEREAEAQKQEEEQKAKEQEDTESQYKLYADQAKGYIQEIADLAESLNDTGVDTVSGVADAYVDLADRIVKTQSEIPEDTTDPTLKTLREMFGIEIKICSLPKAAELTGASSQEFQDQINQYTAQYMALAKQIPEYY